MMMVPENAIYLVTFELRKYAKLNCYCFLTVVNISMQLFTNNPSPTYNDKIVQ